MLSRSTIILAMVIFFISPAFAQQAQQRSTRELEEDLRSTREEYRQYENLAEKLARAGRQSSNTARNTATRNIQDFMGSCIERREGELGEEITLKQHGKMVKSGTTSVAEAGSPVPARKSAKGSGVYDSPNADRLRQLSQMKSLYVSAKNNSRLAVEKQNEAFERYTQTVEKFGELLSLAIDKYSGELDSRNVQLKEKLDN